MVEHSREPEAAVAILHATVPEDSVLLIRRAERADDPWSGHWSLPGGRRSLQDRDLLDTALRELQEECAIRLARDVTGQALPHMFARRKTGRFLLVAPFVFRIERRVVAIPDPREAVEAIWLPLGKMLDPLQHSLRPVPNWPGETLFPATDLDRVPLWGFTYRLLTEWLNLTDARLPAQLPAFQFADSVLSFLVSQGLRVQHGWSEPGIHRDANEDPVIRVATVTGQIPVKAVIDQFSSPIHHVPLVNVLEVHADHLRVVGLRFEQYVIEAIGTGTLSASHGSQQAERS